MFHIIVDKRGTRYYIIVNDVIIIPSVLVYRRDVIICNL